MPIPSTGLGIHLHWRYTCTGDTPALGGVQLPAPRRCTRDVHWGGALGVLEFAILGYPPQSLHWGCTVGMCTGGTPDRNSGVPLINPPVVALGVHWGYSSSQFWGTPQSLHWGALRYHPPVGVVTPRRCTGGTIPTPHSVLLGFIPWRVIVPWGCHHRRMAYYFYILSF